MFAEKEKRPQQSSSSASQHAVQKKLEIGAKDDPQEKEADEVARKVMRKGTHGAVTAGTGAGMIHRMQNEEEKVMTMQDKEDTAHTMKDEEYGKVHKMHDEENGTVMTMPDETVLPETDKVIMMMEADPGGGAGTATPAFQEQLNSTKGSGDPLPGNIQRDFTASTGKDLSGVKVHTDSSAHEMSAGINAKAFTHGQDIYFKQGQYNPTSDSGKELIYHEAQHTVQQGGVKRKVQRNADSGIVKWLAQTYIDLQPTTPLYRYLLNRLRSIPMEERERYQQYTLAKKYMELKQESQEEAPTWVTVLSNIITPPFLPVPGMDALWPLFIQGRMGYYMYQYMVGQKEIKAADGKMTENKLYIKGGTAGLFEKQLADMLDSDFVIGQFEGIFVGIKDWFAGIWDLIKGIGNFLWNAVKNIGALVTGKPSPWMESLKTGAINAAEWIKDNWEQLKLFVVHLIKDPAQPLKQIGMDLKKGIKAAGGKMAFDSGMSMAKSEIGFMSKSGYEKGLSMGKIAGMIIPEVLLAVFSGAIGNAIKGGLSFLRGLTLVAKAGELLSAFMRGLKAAMGAIESIGSTILKFAKGAFSKFGKMFEDVLDFFKGILKWGDEGKLGDNVLEGATDIAETDRKATSTAEHADDLKKGPKEEPKKKPYGDDAMRNAAYAAVAGEVVQSNATHEPMSKFKLDISSLRAKFPIIRSLYLVPSLDGGYDVWMTASPKKWAGHKVVPGVKSKPKRPGSFREAKRDAGIDMGQQPYKVERVKMTDKFGNTVFDENNNPIFTREYYFKNNKGKDIVIQDHSAGHKFGDMDGIGDQGSHFNVRPAEDTRTGTLPGTKPHYNF